MTIAAGFNCTDGIILCADTEESGGLSSYTGKIFESTGSAAGFVGSGRSDYVDMAIEKIRERVQLLNSPDICIIKREIEQVILEIYSRNIASYSSAYPNSQDIPGFDLLIGVRVMGDTVLLKTSDTSIKTVDVFDCIGSGSELRFLANGIGLGTMAIRQGIIFALYLLWMAKRVIPGCGGSSDILVIFNTGCLTVKMAPAPYYEEIENFFGRFSILSQHLMTFGTNDQFENHLSDFSNRLRKLRGSEDSGKAVDQLLQILDNCKSHSGLSKPSTSQT
jgi:hypothetical protein